MNKIAPHNTKIYSWFNGLHGFQLFSPIAIIYFVQVSGSYAAGASLLSAAYIAQVLFEIPTGVLSDKYGRSRTVTFGATCYLLSIISYVIGGSYIVLLIGAVFEGLMRAFYSGNNQALLYESALQDGDDKYHRHMAKTESFFHFSATVSAVLGGLIAIYSLRLVYVASIIPAILMILISTQLIEPKHKESIKQKSLYHVADAVKYLLKNAQLRILALASSVEFGIGHALFGLQMAFVNTIWPIWAVGISRALSGLFATFSFSASGKIIDTFGPLRTIVYSGLWSRAVSFIGLVYPTIASPAIMSASSLSFGSGIVAGSSLEQKEFNSHQRATLGSITSIAGAFWFAVGSFGLGYLADHVGLHEAMLLGLIPLMISTGLYGLIRGRN